MNKRLSLIVQSFQLAQQENVAILLHSALVVAILLLTFIPPFAFGNQIDFMREQALSVTFFIMVFYVIFIVNALVQKERNHGTYWLLQAHGVSSITYTFSRFFGIILSFIPLFLSAIFAVSLSLNAIHNSELHLEPMPLNVGLGCVLIVHALALGLQYLLNIRYGLVISYGLPLLLGFASMVVGIYDAATVQAIKYLLFLGVGFMVYTAMVMMLSRFFVQSIVMLMGIVLVVFGVVAPYIAYVQDVAGLFIVSFQRYYAIESMSVVLLVFSCLQTGLFLALSALEVRR